MAHILFLEWNSFGNEYIKRAWEKQGDSYVSFPFSTKENTRYGDKLTKSIVMALLSEPFDYVFSFNYFPVAAMAAKACKVCYVSWVYDNPYAQLYSETVFYETNDIRLFDTHEVEKLRNLGVSTVSYLPLAADVAYYDTFDDIKQDVHKYEADVSFVGALYTSDKQQLYRRFEALPQYEKGFLDGLVSMQQNLYGMNLLEDMLQQNGKLLDSMQDVAPLMEHPDAFATPAWYYANFYMNRHITMLERTNILTRVSQMEDVSLKVYTGDSFLPAYTCPVVDYYDEAPFVYKNSKINLNISLRSIQTGIPLRVFDIMGCGGFLLTNYQEDMLLHFEPGIDFVYYTDMQDCIDKIAYYLSHDEERKKIALNGYKKIKKLHTYGHRVYNLTKKT